MPTALVTGATGRIGQAIGVALIEAGYDVVLHAHRSHTGIDALQALATREGRRAEAVWADLEDPTAATQLTAAARAQSGEIVALINNAAAYEEQSFATLSPGQLQHTLTINLQAPLLLTQALLPDLSASRGCVVNITDASVRRPYAGYTHYLVSKAALEMATRALAVELAPSVRVNAVAPGAVSFPTHFDSTKRAAILRRVPLGAEGTPEDVARAVLFLMRDAPYVTGQVLAVDGGVTAG